MERETERQKDRQKDRPTYRTTERKTCIWKRPSDEKIDRAKDSQMER